MKPQKYTKKPVTIEAMQWDGTAAGAGPVINWVLAAGPRAARFHDDAKHMAGPGRGITTVRDRIEIDTLEGTMHALPGDFVIRGVQGEFYPCKPDIFAATYVPAGGSES